VKRKSREEKSKSLIGWVDGEKKQGKLIARWERKSRK